MLVMHATTQMIPKCILLIEKKQDPIGYILFDSVHMTLWKGKATEMETILAHPDNQGLRGGAWLTTKRTNGGHGSLQYWGGINTQVRTIYINKWGRKDRSSLQIPSTVILT